MGTDYEVTKLGDSYASHYCHIVYSMEKVPTGLLTCGGMGVGMMIDTKTLRFIELYTHGYLENDMTGNNTPFLNAGTCTKISD